MKDLPFVPFADDDSITSVASSVASLHPSSFSPLHNHRRPSHRQRRPPNLHVSFDAAPPTRYANTDYCREDGRALWYTTIELQCFRIAAVEVARRVSLHDKALMRTRNGKKHLSSSSYLHVLERTYNSCCRNHNGRSPGLPSPARWSAASSMSMTGSDDWMMAMSLEEEREWVQWVSSTPTRLGLERLTVDRIRSDTAARRQLLWQKVKELSDDGKGLDPAKLDFVRRLTCEKISRPSRIFARRLAEGVAEGDEINVTQSLFHSDSRLEL